MTGPRNSQLVTVSLPRQVPRAGRRRCCEGAPVPVAIIRAALDKSLTGQQRLDAPQAIADVGLEEERDRALAGAERDRDHRCKLNRGTLGCAPSVRSRPEPQGDHMNAKLDQILERTKQFEARADFGFALLLHWPADRPEVRLAAAPRRQLRGQHRG